MMEGAAGGSAGDRFALYDLFAAYGALIEDRKSTRLNSSH